MRLSVEELFHISIDLKKYLGENWDYILARLNTADRLDEFNELVGFNGWEGGRVFHPLKNKRILIIGESRISKQDLLVAVKKMGFSKERFEMFFDYDDIKRLDISKYRYDLTCSAILVGPMPHSGIGKGDFSSIIAALEGLEGFAPVERLGGNELKITKSSVTVALQRLLNNGQIEK